MIKDLFKINSNGITVPTYPEVLEDIKNQYKAIFGDDVYLEPDSKDGAMIAIFALAVYDTIETATQIYNSFSPLTASGDSLSRQVKINGIERALPSNSTADLRIVGVAGTQLTDCKAEDVDGNKWIIPTTLIPLSGEITITAQAENVGAITAQANTINKINTPILGWQSVNNPTAAAVGESVETDAELRQRQTISVALPSQTILDGIAGAVSNLNGVVRLKAYENDSHITDINGLPPHSLSVVVDGGDTQEIVNAIAVKKTLGSPTYGATSAVYVDSHGIPNTINFFRPTQKFIDVEIKIIPLSGYTVGYADMIKASVVGYINGLGIGADVSFSRLFCPALVSGISHTYDIESIKIAFAGGSVIEQILSIAFNEAAFAELNNIEVITV